MVVFEKKIFDSKNFFGTFFENFFFRSFMAKMVSNCAIFDTESLAISDSLKSTLGGAIMEKIERAKIAENHIWA